MQGFSFLQQSNVYDPADRVTERFASSGINSGWAEAFLELDQFEETLSPDPAELVSVVEEATSRLRYYGVIGETEKPPEVERITGMEVGDDRKDESKSPTGLAISLVVQESVFKMITSEEDTFISKDRSNFCEVTTVVPRSQVGSFDYARKNNSTSNLEFVDVMPLRLVLDVSKSNQNDHSSSVPGKASMAGPKMAYSRPDLKEILQLGNLLQDGILLTIRGKEPKYLPTIMGGSGSPALFGSARNLYLYMQSYRGGGHSRVYGTSTNEIMQTFATMEQTGAYSPPELTLRLRMKETYLYGTYKEKVFVPTKQFQNLQRETALPPPIYEGGRATTDLAIGESRLVAAKLLITRSQAEVEAEKTRRNTQVLFGAISHSGMKEAMKQARHRERLSFDGALSANTALARMLERRANDTDAEKMMKDSFFKFSRAGERDFEFSHAQWIVDGAKSNTYDIRDLRRPEDMFVRTEVSTEENMKVSGIERVWVKKGLPILTETTASVGLWQVSESMYQHAEGTLRKLVEARERSDNPTLDRSQVLEVLYDRRKNDADDGHILIKSKSDVSASTVGSGVLVLISTDKHLAKVMAAQTGKRILRIAPSVIVPATGADSERTISAMDGNPALLAKFVSFHKDLKLNFSQILGVYVDTGSLQAALTHFVVSELPERKPSAKVYSRRVIEVGVDRDGHRFEKTGLKALRLNQSRVSIGPYRSKDTNGSFLWEFHKPNTIRLRVSKYEAFINKSGADSLSESESGFSQLSDVGQLEIRSEEEFNFSPFLNPDNLD
jgi:hypothetical protein